MVIVPAILLSLALLLPFVPTDAWPIRILEFPRLQLTLIALVALVPVPFVLRDAWGIGTTALGAAALGTSLFRLAPHLLPGEPVRGPGCDDALTVMTVNVRKGNRDVDALLAAVEQADPDVLLTLETDTWWDEHLSRLDASYPEHVQAVEEADRYYGMHLFSRRPLDAKVRFLVPNDVPSIVGTLDGRIQVVALHPRPPHMFETAELRDDQLDAAAKLIGSASQPVVVMGDFNAVPWERVYEDFQRVARLTDPRESLGRLSSYRLKGLQAWPLDHILWRDALQLDTYELGPDVGSDHLPVIARFCPA